MSPLRTFLVLGAGGHGKSVAEAALLSGEWQRVCFLDDRWPQLEVVCGIDVIGDLDSLLEPGLSVAGGIAAVGNNSLREARVERSIAAASRWSALCIREPGLVRRLKSGKDRLYLRWR